MTALNTSGIDAKILSATTSGDTGVGVTLAFNTLGWKSQNILFNAVDALLGDPLISEAFHGEQPAEALAYILNSDVNSAGGRAGHRRQRGAAERDAEQRRRRRSPRALHGANGKAIGGLLASNKVSTHADGVHRAHTTASSRAAIGTQIVDSHAEHARHAPPTLRRRRARPRGLDGRAERRARRAGRTSCSAPATARPTTRRWRRGSQTHLRWPRARTSSLADGYGAPDYFAVSLNGLADVEPRCPATRVKLTPFYGTQGTYETGSGTKTLNKGDTVVVSTGYTGGGTPGKVYVTWNGADGSDRRTSAPQVYDNGTTWLP